jgi:exopolyphosphatase/guanosine-5'-triphosphate,3'-diphosphate pyrophosphatase
MPDAGPADAPGHRGRPHRQDGRRRNDRAAPGDRAGHQPSLGRTGSPERQDPERQDPNDAHASTENHDQAIQDKATSGQATRGQAPRWEAAHAGQKDRRGRPEHQGRNRHHKDLNRRSPQGRPLHGANGATDGKDGKDGRGNGRGHGRDGAAAQGETRPMAAHAGGREDAQSLSKGRDRGGAGGKGGSAGRPAARGADLASRGDGNRSDGYRSDGAHGIDTKAAGLRAGLSGGAGPSGTGHRRRPDAFEHEDGPPPLYAALDLGTNNCRLLIAQPTRPGQFRVVDGFSRIVRLGEGLAASGRLSEDAMNRSVEALKICAAKLGNRNIRRSRLIATEAARAAENGVAFMERVATETGLELEIIDRETEARLAVSGCASLVGRDARSVVLFDIGGGSSEIAVLRIDDTRSSRLANHITHWTSLPVGVVTLSERHGGRDVTPESFEGMIAEVSGMLDRFDCPDIAAVHRPAEDFHLIGTSGTVTTLAGVHLDLPRYDRRLVDGLWLSDAEVTAMQARLLSWDFAARAANPCIGPDRADLVLAGCAILEAIRRRWPSPRMRVADRGLREGLLTDMMADDGVWRRGRGRRPGRFGTQNGSEEGRNS